MVILCDQADTMMLEPLVGIAVVETLEEAFHQAVTTGVDL